MSKIQVRLQDGTIGVPDKFLVYDIEYNTQLQAELSIKQPVINTIKSYIQSNTNLDFYCVKAFTDCLYKLDKQVISDLAELLKLLT
jgi:hypothetical protein